MSHCFKVSTKTVNESVNNRNPHCVCFEVVKNQDNFTDPKLYYFCKQKFNMRSHRYEERDVEWQNFRNICQIFTQRLDSMKLCVQCYECFMEAMLIEALMGLEAHDFGH